MPSATIQSFGNYSRLHQNFERLSSRANFSESKAVGSPRLALNVTGRQKSSITILNGSCVRLLTDVNSIMSINSISTMFLRCADVVLKAESVELY